MLGFTASAAGVFIGAKYRALDSCKTHTHRSSRGAEVSAVYQAHGCLDLSVCGGKEGGVWVMFLFFQLRGEEQFCTGVGTCLLWMNVHYRCEQYSGV